MHHFARLTSNCTFFFRLERAKKLQEQKEKEMFEKQQHQQEDIVAGEAEF